MQDRVPTPGQEGRVLITPENGEAFYAKVQMADNPTQDGTPLNKETLLQDSTEISIFGNAADRTVDEAFSGLSDKIQLIMQNVASMTLTVTDTDGTPLQGVYVSGIFDEDGDAVKTNASGQAIGYVAEGASTLSVTGYADIQNYSESFSAVKGEAYTKTFTVTTRNFLRMTSSQSLRFSENVEQVDVSVGAGGGSGGLGEPTAAGAGGAGGRSTVQEDVSFATNVFYQAVIGAGGPAQHYLSEPGSDGGNSSFLGVTALGGGRATVSDGESQGGIGNGNGGTPNETETGGNGQTYLYTSYTEQELYGGGGGAGGSLSSDPGFSGGNPGGGDGGKYEEQGNDGVDGKGGGGGGAGGDGGWPSGKGGDGAIAIRMHLKSAA